jgi:hypothetical protein
MPLTAQDVSNNSYSEYSRWSYIGNQSYGYWDGLNYIIVNVYENNTSGSMTLQLKTTDAQKCTILFDSSSTTNTPVTDTSGTIAISATSGNGLFDVTNTYTVNGIDKQAVSMTFNPDTGPINGYAQIPLVLGITLASNDISGGTVLPFVGTTFAGAFSPALDSICSTLSRLVLLRKMAVSAKPLHPHPPISCVTTNSDILAISIIKKYLTQTSHPWFSPSTTHRSPSQPRCPLATPTQPEHLQIFLPAT